MIYSQRYALLFLSFLLIFVSVDCGFAGREKRSLPRGGPAQGIRKVFPDGSQYWVLFSLPGYFPREIPVYNRGRIERIYVYAERDMDVILKTSSGIEDIVKFYQEEYNNKNWKVKLSAPDSEAELKKFKLQLSYNNYPVDTMTLIAVRGHIISASLGPVISVCRIIEAGDSKNCYIFQQIRTPRQ